MMRVELSNLDPKDFRRAMAQLDAAGIDYNYDANPGAPNSLVHTSDAAACRRFVNVALHDPDAKVYR